MTECKDPFLDFGEMVEDLNIKSQLQELRDMEDGWLDGSGLKSPDDFITFLEAQFVRYYPKDLIPPYVYPTEDGGVMFEWSLYENAIHLEVDPSTYKAEFSVLNLDTGVIADTYLDTKTTAAWTWLAETIRSFMESPTEKVVVTH